MKTENKLYYIISYIFFILSPFIWGLVEIYSEGNNENPHLITLLINVIIYLLLAIIITILILKKRIHVPTSQEIKYLLFGFAGNVIIYFYTFQNILKIDDVITIYSTLLMILIVYYLLIEPKLRPLELWIFSIAFLILDFAHLLYTGCGHTDSYQCFENAGVDAFNYMIYTIIIFGTIGYYTYKIYKLNTINIAKVINILLIITIGVLIQNEANFDTKLFGTLMIILPFVLIIDFIVSIVNKTYTHNTLIFYIRTMTIFSLLMFIGETGYFYGESNRETLYIMVAILYVSLGVTILSFLLNIRQEDGILVRKHVKYVKTDNHLLYQKYFPELQNKNEEYELFVLEVQRTPVEYIILKPSTDIPDEIILDLTHQEIDLSTFYMYVRKIELELRKKQIRQLRIISDHPEMFVNTKFAYLNHNEYIKTI